MKTTVNGTLAKWTRGLVSQTGFLTVDWDSKNWDAFAIRLPRPNLPELGFRYDHETTELWAVYTDGEIGCEPADVREYERVS